MSKIRAGFTKMVVLLLILLIAPAVPVSAEPAPAFQDVKTGDWFIRRWILSQKKACFMEQATISSLPIPL